jgi:hypothetical protein
MSGGMHVGPNDPLYSSRLQQGGRRLPRGVLPGARFDPITPQGLPVIKEYNNISFEERYTMHAVRKTHDVLKLCRWL